MEKLIEAGVTALYLVEHGLSLDKWLAAGYTLLHLATLKATYREWRMLGLRHRHLVSGSLNEKDASEKVLSLLLALHLTADDFGPLGIRLDDLAGATINELHRLKVVKDTLQRMGISIHFIPNQGFTFNHSPTVYSSKTLLPGFTGITFHQFCTELN